MPQYSSVSQRTFVKGLNASTGLFEQPKGTIPSISNLLFTIRGALRSTYGSSILTSYQGNGRTSNPIAGPIKKIIWAQNVTNQTAGFIFLHDSLILLTPTYNLSITSVNVAGGTLVPGQTYQYQFAMIDNPLSYQGSTGIIGFPTTIAIVLAAGMNAVQLTWDTLPGPWGFVITGRTAASDNNYVGVTQNSITLVQTPSGTGPTVPTTPLTFTDTGATLGPVVTNFSATNTINVVVLEKPSPIVIGPNRGKYSYFTGTSTTLAYFPAGPALAQNVGNITEQFSGNGGVVGLTSATPDLLEFANFVIVILGNGYPMQIYNQNSNTTSPVTNTFQAQYPNWQPSVTNLVGDYIVPDTPNSYFYTCTQAGETGTTEPTFPTIVGQTVTDFQAIWKCVGLVTSSPPPSGAAHATAYAGSLWVFNTAPSNSADGLNGPSSIMMSDIDDPTSWNPINQAFIGKDDGSEGMGLSSFTIAETGIPPTGSLVAFKNYSTYQIIGVFGAQDFAIQAVQSDMGCIAPRTIQFLSGYGLVRLGHMGYAIFNGVRDLLFSEELRPYLYGDNPTTSGNLPAIDWSYAYLSSATQSVSPPSYVCAVPIGNSNGLMTRIFNYDTVLKAWSRLDLPVNPILAMTIRTMYQSRQPGNQPFTLAGSATDSTIGYLFYGDATWLDGSPVSWTVTSPEYYNQQSPSARNYYRKVIVRGRYLNNSSPVANPIAVSICLDGSDPVGEGSMDIQSPLIPYPYQLLGNANGFIIDIAIGDNATNAHIVVSGTGQVEIDEFEWFTQAKTAGVPPRIT